MIPVGIPTKTQWVFKALAVAAVLTACFAAGWTVNGWRLDVAHQAEAASRATATVRQFDQAIAAHQADQAKMQEITHAQLQEATRNAGALAAARRDADGLRDRLAGVLRVGSGASDSLAACQQRAETAGQLLADGLRVQAELAGAAESHAADLRALRARDELTP